MSSRRRVTRSGAKERDEDVSEALEEEGGLEAVITAPTFSDAKETDPSDSAVDEATYSEEERLGHVCRVLNLDSKEDQERLGALGVTSVDDLMFVVDEDLAVFSPAKRGKLSALIKYLLSGRIVDETFSAPALREFFRGRKEVRAETGTDKTSGQAASSGTSLSSAVPKIVIPDFNGDPSKWYLFEIRVRAALGQAQLLDAALGIDRDVLRRQQVFFLLMSATSAGPARVHVKRHQVTKDGAAAWKDLSDHYGGEDRRLARCAELRRRIQNLRISTTKSATDTVAALEEAALDLEELGEAMSEGALIDSLINAVAADSLYEPMVPHLEQLCADGRPLRDAIQAVRARESRLDATMSKAEQRNARRVVTKEVKASPRAKKHTTKRRESRKCYLCGKRGHIASNCPERSSAHSERSGEQDGSNDQVSESNESSKPRVDFRSHRKARMARISEAHLAPERDTTVAIVDSGADQCVLSALSGWTKLSSRPGTTVLVGPSGQVLGHGSEIVTGAAIARTDDNQPVVVLVHEAVWLPDVTDALLQPYQMKRAGIIVNEALGTHDIGGTKDDSEPTRSIPSLEVDGHILPLQQVGASFGLCVDAVSLDDLDELPILSLTEDVPWDPYDDKETLALRVVARQQMSEEEYGRWKATLNIVDDKKLKATLHHTTSLAVSEVRNPMRRHMKSRFPHLRVRRLKGTLYTDTWFASCPSREGHTCSQLFYLKEADFVKNFPMKSERGALAALREFILTIGAPDEIRSDNANAQTSKEWSELCRKYAIRTATTEPHSPWQNRGEAFVGRKKASIARLLAQNQAPVCFWSDAVLLDDAQQQLQPTQKLHWTGSPYSMIYGETPDRSAFVFTFYEPVVYLDVSKKFPEPKELPARWLGLAPTSGDVLTYLILDVVSQQVLVRSNVRSMTAREISMHQHQLSESSAYWTTGADREGSDNDADHVRIVNGKVMVILPGAQSRRTDLPRDMASSASEPLNSSLQPDTTSASDKDEVLLESNEQEEQHTLEDLVGRQVKKDFNGSPFFGTIVEQDEYCRVQYFDGDTEDLDYDEALAILTSESEQEYYQIERILSHRRKSGGYELEVLWSDGSTTFEPLKQLRKDDPITTASYVAAHIMEDDRLRRWAMKVLKVRRIALRRATRKPSRKIKHGVPIPRTVRDAMLCDRERGDRLWEEAIKKELLSWIKLGVFEFYETRDVVPPDHQLGHLHFVFDIKHDGRRKARLVAEGNRIDAGSLETYGPVMRYESLRILMLAAIEKSKKIIKADVSTAYLYATTRERVVVRCGPEFTFMDRDGWYAVLNKAVYGLKTSAYEWALELGDKLRPFNASRCYGDNCVWRILVNDNPVDYDYILTYVDDVVVISHDPDKYLDALEEHFDLKDRGPVDYHLGSSYAKRDGYQCSGPSRYVEERVRKKEEEYGPLRKYKTPLAHGDHPEQDQSHLLDEDGARQYQAALGELNWIVICGRIDLCFAVNCLGAFAAAPRVGHMERILRVYGYLKRTSTYMVMMDPCNPKLLNIETFDFEDELDMYGDVIEETDPNEPIPAKTRMKLMAFVDSDHGHDTSTRRSVTGYVIYLGSTPVVWRSRRQKTVETSTFGAEFAAMRECVEAVISIRYMIRSFGIEIKEPTLILADNLGVVTSATNIAGSLKKKHVALAYHRVGEAIAASIVQVAYVASEYNLADVLTKPLPGPTHRTIVTTILV